MLFMVHVQILTIKANILTNTFIFTIFCQENGFNGEPTIILKIASQQDLQNNSFKIMFKNIKIITYLGTF